MMLLPKLHYPTVEAEIMDNFAASIAGLNLDAYDKGYQYMAKQLQERNKQSA